MFIAHSMNPDDYIQASQDMYVWTINFGPERSPLGLPNKSCSGHTNWCANRAHSGALVKSFSYYGAHGKLVSRYYYILFFIILEVECEGYCNSQNEKHNVILSDDILLIHNHVYDIQFSEEPKVLIKTFEQEKVTSYQFICYKRMTNNFWPVLYIYCTLLDMVKALALFTLNPWHVSFLSSSNLVSRLLTRNVLKINNCSIVVIQLSPVVRQNHLSYKCPISMGQGKLKVSSS